MIQMFQSMPIEEKKQLPYLMLDDIGTDPTNDEMIYSMISD